MSAGFSFFSLGIISNILKARETKKVRKVKCNSSLEYITILASKFEATEQFHMGLCVILTGNVFAGTAS